ncbi:MAG: potassium/proton antiporter [Bacteroidetes bacterium]|nr:potassium/proton antiporter [Bacteroidota bacterium]
MVLTSENILLIGSVMLIISVIGAKTSSRFGIPTLLLFLIVGMFAGSEGPGGIAFADSKTAQFIGSISLCLILFSGGLDSRWHDMKPILWPGLLLSTIGVIISAFTVAFFVTLVTGFTFMEGLLLGAIVSSTDAAAVFSILRSMGMGLKGHLRPLLEFESGSNDPMAFFLTIAVAYLLSHPGASIVHLIPMFFQQMIIGAVAGYGMGRLMHFLLIKIRLDVDGLYSVLLIAMVLFTFSFTSFIGGNSFLAVYISAFVLGNRDFLHKRSLTKHFDGQAWLMQVVLFITLGLLVFPSQIWPLAGIGLLISLFLIFIARPLAVFFCLSFFKVNIRTRVFVSWVGLRGAVPIVFATYPLTEGISKAPIIFNLVFFITVSSVLIQGTSLPIVAKWLHLLVPDKARKKSILEKELTRRLKSLIAEYEVQEGFSCVGKSLVNIGIPGNVMIVFINRNDSYITPEGSTIIEIGDKLMIMAESKAALDAMFRCLITGKKADKTIVEEDDELPRFWPPKKEPKLLKARKVPTLLKEHKIIEKPINDAT